MHRIPVVHGSIFRFEGQLTVFKPYEGPCYRCLFPQPPPAELAPSCAEAGVLGVLPGIMGIAPGDRGAEAAARHRRAAVGRLLLVDALRARRSTRSRLRRDPSCPVCGEHAGDDPLHRLRGVLRGRRPRGSGDAGGGCLTMAVKLRMPPVLRAAGRRRARRRGRGRDAARGAGRPVRALPRRARPARRRRRRAQPLRQRLRRRTRTCASATASRRRWSRAARWRASRPWRAAAGEPDRPRGAGAAATSSRRSATRRWSSCRACAPTAARGCARSWSRPTRRGRSRTASRCR